MCGRTTLTVPQSVLEARFDATVAFDWSLRYNISPGQGHPVILNESPESIESLHWGLIPQWTSDRSKGNSLINARSETIHEKPAFRDAFEKRRCLVLVDGFYEWRKQAGGNQPYRIVREDERPFAMAGVWNRWKGDDESVDSMAIVTTDANEVVSPIHDRMPVMFEPEREREWLTAGSDAARELLTPIDSDQVRAYPVSTQVNNSANEYASLIEPVEDIQQSGLGDFAS